jgi:hypothetical protein
MLSESIGCAFPGTGMHTRRKIVLLRRHLLGSGALPGAIWRVQHERAYSGRSVFGFRHWRHGFEFGGFVSGS